MNKTYLMFRNRCCEAKVKAGLLPSKKSSFESPLKMMQNVFLFHLKSSFRSQDI